VSADHPVVLEPAEARSFLLGHLGLRHPLGTGSDGVRAVLTRLGMIQLDPLDRIGTNADLVAHARIDGLQRGDVYDALLPGHAFEHFAKERCLLPADRFPRYRDRLLEVPWWRHNERMKRVPDGVLDAVEAEIDRRGPLTTHDLEDRGRTAPMDWNGWKGTTRIASLAVRVLWTRCRLVTHARTSRGKRWDLPSRALPHVSDAPGEARWERAALLERVDAAGLLPVNAGPWWGLLTQVRKSLSAELVAEGALVRVQLPGSGRTWLARPESLETSAPEDDGRMRVLGPLDPVLWDRALVQLAFDFEYVWEVYKPAAQRRWGYYVCPLLHEGALVGRVEAHREGDELVVDRLWEERPGSVDPVAWGACRARLEAFQPRREDAER
jgi:uncharacterized protein YcaQ